MTIVQSQLKDLERRLAEAKGPNYALEEEIERILVPADFARRQGNYSSDLVGAAARPYTASLDAAVGLVGRVLPGWFWTTGKCKLNAHATVGPDRDGPDAHLLKDPTFDNGFDADMEHGIPALALCLACVRALIAQGEK